MTKQEQHDLLVRLDERTRNIWRSVEKMEKHQAEQNGSLQLAITRLDKHETFIRVFLQVARYTGIAAGIAFLGWLGIKIPSWLR